MLTTPHRLRGFSVRRAILTAAILLSCATAWAQQQFVLQVPGRAELTSKALLQGNQLLIVDAQGQRHTYTRQPRFDAVDGSYLAFHSAQAQQFIRWPANNTGAMLIGGPRGQNWRKSKQSIRVAGGGNVQPRQPRPGMVRKPVIREDREQESTGNRVAAWDPRTWRFCQRGPIG